MEHELDPKIGTILYVTISGSKLYGTDDETSDTDYKGIFLPSKESLILNKVEHTINLSSNKSRGKNSADDVDYTLDSLHKWLGLIEKGETGALDVLFSMFDVQSNEIVDAGFNKLIKQNYKQMLHKNPKAFVGYCIAQAKRYSVKGDRYHELKEFYDFMGSLSSYGKLSESYDVIKEHLAENGYKYIKFVMAAGARHSQPMNYLEVLGRKFAPTIESHYMYNKLTDLEESYGDRAKNCNTNVEWKSLSHAVRVITEIEELMTSKFITFPLPNADYIYRVKKGKVDLEEVVLLIEEKIELIDALTESSDLPDKVDRELLDGMIKQFYR